MSASCAGMQVWRCSSRRLLHRQTCIQRRVADAASSLGGADGVLLCRLQLSVSSELRSVKRKQQCD